MEVSSTSINVASITAMATSQGFFAGAALLLAGCGVILFLPQASVETTIYRCDVEG